MVKKSGKANGRRSVVLSFVGAGQDYKSADYVFPDGAVWKSTFFGRALVRYRTSQGQKPDAVIVFGTGGSAWQKIIDNEDTDGLDETAFASLEPLLQLPTDAQPAARDDAAMQSLLDQAAPTLATCYGVETFYPRAIGMCADPADHQALMGMLMDTLEPGDRVTLDITHAYRHLPVLVAFMLTGLRWLRDVEVERIWYGGMFSGHGSNSLFRAVDLSEAARIEHMGANLATYRHTGVFVQFADSFPTASDAMRRAHLFEATNQPGRGMSAAQEMQGALRRSASTMSPFDAEIKDELIDRLDWPNERTWEGRYLARAERALKYGDYITAALIEGECIRNTLLRLDDPDFDSTTLDPKEEHERIVRSLNRNLSRDEGDVYRRLRTVRNCVAHGTYPPDYLKGEINPILNNEAKLKRLLRDGLELARNLAEDLRRCDAENT